MKVPGLGREPFGKLATQTRGHVFRRATLVSGRF